MASRPFAVLKAGYGTAFVEKTYGGFGKMTSKLLRDEGEEWVEFSVVDGDFSFEKRIDEFAGFVVTGSPADAHADEDWIVKLCEVLRLLDQMKKKVLGICFGHQVLARALGGKTGRADIGWEIGLKQLHLDSEMVSNLYKVELPSTLKVLESHRDQVSDAPPGAVILGFSKNAPIEMFAVGDHALGVQYHPEFSKDVVLHIIQTRLAENVFSVEIANEAIQSLEESEPDSEQLKDLCKAFLKGHGKV